VEVTNALSSLSAVLCHDPGDNSTSYICSECPINSSVTINNYQLESSGWNICGDDPGSFPYFGYALYKMNNDRTNDFFILTLGIVIMRLVFI
jgi:hypothetical protein